MRGRENLAVAHKLILIVCGLDRIDIRSQPAKRSVVEATKKRGLADNFCSRGTNNITRRPQQSYFLLSDQPTAAVRQFVVNAHKVRASE